LTRKNKNLMFIPCIIISHSLYDNLASILYIVDVIVKGKIILWAIKFAAIEAPRDSWESKLLYEDLSHNHSIDDDKFSTIINIHFLYALKGEYSKVLITGCSCVLFILCGETFLIFIPTDFFNLFFFRPSVYGRKS
jgi:hypothetical protein